MLLAICLLVTPLAVAFVHVVPFHTWSTPFEVQVLAGMPLALAAVGTLIEYTVRFYTVRIAHRPRPALAPATAG